MSPSRTGSGRGCWGMGGLGGGRVNINNAITFVILQHLAVALSHEYF